ncbi:M-phase phosphoprotein 6 isoform X2 [Lampris incognitus]|uniref:M-phase phosphoprotein 6 isoform X2 n=1 Tax=Lampris incognitus TaxID=2546036 RepID=UPI0024B53AA2|nr:M-phase phosphoprotein 6 isoform X2 [Lampris incognitus]
MADHSVKFSKNILRMKFMQRGLDEETKKYLEEDEKRIINDEHWYLDIPELTAQETFVIEERSFVPCEDLKYGRMSFKGFNPEVEDRAEEEEDLGRMETDITDEDMARRYESLVGSMKKKFAKKREWSAIEEEEDVNHNIAETNKRVFLKPQD